MTFDLERLFVRQGTLPPDLLPDRFTNCLDASDAVVPISRERTPPFDLFDVLSVERFNQLFPFDHRIISDSGDAVEPVKRTRQRKPTPVARQAAMPPTLTPRLISRDAAAVYVGVSPNTFDKMIAEGLMPGPRRLSERRLAWDVRQLDAAIDRLPINGVVDGNADTDTTDDHSWDDIDAQAQIRSTSH